MTASGRVCVLCSLAVPTRSEPDRAVSVIRRSANDLHDPLRQEHARICTGKPSPEAVEDALVAADALVALDFANHLLPVDHPAHPENVKQQLRMARALYEQRFRLALGDDRGWYAKRRGIGEQYVCVFCRVEICEVVIGGEENSLVARRLSDRHATICALHFVGGLREPVNTSSRNPDPERPDFK